MSLTVGQKLWYVPREIRRGRGEEVTVQKIGHKWANIGWKLRIDVETLIADGGQYSPPGRCYLSREEYEAEVERERVWREFYRRLSYNPPKVVSTDEIREIAARWGIAIPEGN